MSVQQKAPKNLRRKYALVAGGIATTMVTQANAAAFDVSGIIKTITDQETTVVSVGTAILGVVVLTFVLTIIRRLLR